ncbi:MAG: ATP-binding cassette domain-containing protein, partial [Chloroflexota bacterium]|nr:ATP-binding cassette domain-containing protein [Chloroflexota bacterium]
MASDVVLEARRITKQFGGLTAVSEVDLVVHKGSIASLIGPNGAGKTTFFNMVSGFYQASSGQLIFMGTETRGMRPNRITKLGIGRTF